MFDNTGKIRKRYFSCQRDSMKIFCEMIVPVGEGPFPLIIYAHPFGDTVHVVKHELVAYQGIAVCSFDFCGGSLESKSDGASTDMSVLTEVADLKTVLEEVKKLSVVDKEKIYLLGMSQGGYVSTMVSALYPYEIAGLVLICPAFALQDCEKIFWNGKEVPERFWFHNMSIGRKYVADLKSVDIYHMMEKYSGPVLICYGDKDEIVPQKYIKRALQVFQNARLVTIPGAGHYIQPSYSEFLLNEIIPFVKECEDIKCQSDFMCDSEIEDSPQDEQSLICYDEKISDKSVEKDKIHISFIYITPESHAKNQMAVLSDPYLTMHIAGSFSYDQAEELAKNLVSKGCSAIELSSGFGNEGVARIQKAVGYEIPVGAVKYDFNPILRFRGGDAIFQ